MVYNWVGDGNVTWCVEGVAQVVHVNELKRKGCVMDMCSMFWWMGSGIFLSNISLC